MEIWFNRSGFNSDVALGLWKQCSALALRGWARFRHDPLLDIRSNRDFMFGAVQARYGWSRAQIAARVRELERGI